MSTSSTGMTDSWTCQWPQFTPHQDISIITSINRLWSWTTVRWRSFQTATTSTITPVFSPHICRLLEVSNEGSMLKVELTLKMILSLWLHAYINRTVYPLHTVPSVSTIAIPSREVWAICYPLTVVSNARLRNNRRSTGKWIVTVLATNRTASSPPVMIK